MVWGVDGTCAAGVELGKGPYRVASILRRLRARHRVRFVLRSLGLWGGKLFAQSSQVWLILRQRFLNQRVWRQDAAGLKRPRSSYSAQEFSINRGEPWRKQ